VDSQLIAVDTETTGLDLFFDEIWEFSAIIRLGGGVEERVSFFIEHDMTRAENLPTPFFNDYKRRYDPDAALTRRQAAIRLTEIFQASPYIIGANPAFDMYRIEWFIRNEWNITWIPTWKYHLIDVENMMVGWAKGLHLQDADKLNWRSDDLSRMVGVDPSRFDRHTAMGDCEWVLAIYDKITYINPSL
jgi:hypothetical protein